MRISRKSLAFTILELLTVVAIIVVLAALILHGMGYAQQKAAASRASAEIHAISLIHDTYKHDHGAYVSSAKTDELDPNGVKPSDSVYSPCSALLAAQLLGGQVAAPNAEAQKLGVSEQHMNIFRQRWTKSYGGQWKTDALSTTYAVVEIPNLHKASDEEPDILRVAVKYFMDPFGYAYGYSTFGRFNPKDVSYDLWSAAGTTDKTAAMQAKWIKNW